MHQPLSFVDSQGVGWLVSEVDESDPVGSASVADRARMPGDYLRFESANEVRRMWRYPDDWSHLTPQQLEYLCSQAHVVVARFRSVAPLARHSLSGDELAEGA